MDLPRVLVACNQQVRESRVTDPDIARLEKFARWEWYPCDVPIARGGLYQEPVDDPAAAEKLKEALADVDALVVCSGSPRITADVMEAAPRLKFIGEMEGDRFAARMDVEAAQARGIRVTDTTNASSYPVSEWALGMMLIALRNAGEQYRHLIGNEVYHRPVTDLGYVRGELTGKKVGLIGCGIIGRRLLELLVPFHCDVRVYDPYLSRDIADAYGFLQTNLDFVMSDSDVIVCLAPITPRTHRMVGKRELDLMQPGSALVNVSRGAIIDPDALIDRMARGDVTGAFDVFDPEPIPADSRIRHLPNVFLTPHIAGVVLANGPRGFKLMVDELDRALHGHETRFDLTARVLANRRGQ
jgi:phosphoglycerate dehydrogenase-like enzyme